jgi:hypothetical protein
MLLPSDFWVQALIRRAEAGGAHAAVLRRGDDRAGAVLVKVVNRREGWARLYAQALRREGEEVWMQPVQAADEATLDAYADRAWSRDPDIWVVEIDDPKGRHFLQESVETPQTLTWPPAGEDR